MPRPLLTVVFGLLLWSSSAGQLVHGGDYVIGDYSTAIVFRVSHDGLPTVVHFGAPLRGVTDVAVTQARDLIIADFDAGTLFRLPSTGGITPVATGLRMPIRVAVDRNGDYIVTELALPGITRVTPQGTRTVLQQGAPFQHPIGIAVDSDGTYLVADDFANALFRYVPGGGVIALHSGPPFRLPQGVAVLASGDYAVTDGLADAVFVVARGGGAVTTLVAPPVLGNPYDVVDDFEGGVAVSDSSGASRRLVRVDAAGQLTVVTVGPPFGRTDGLDRAPTLAGPSRGQSGRAHSLDLELPAQANRPYLLCASLSLHPGFALSPAPRRAAVNPDGLFFASLGANDPVFVGFTGVLDPWGRATASLTVPNVPMPPITIFLQGFVIDLQQPSSVREITNAHGIAF